MTHASPTLLVRALDEPVSPVNETADVPADRRSTP